MSPITLDELRAAASTLKMESVSVPELGEAKAFWLAELSATELESRIGEAWKAAATTSSAAGFRAFVVAACWCASESRDFVAAKMSDVLAVSEVIGRQSQAVVGRLYDAAARLNGLDEDHAKN